MSRRLGDLFTAIALRARMVRETGAVAEATLREAQRLEEPPNMFEELFGQYFPNYGRS